MIRFLKDLVGDLSRFVAGLVADPRGRLGLIIAGVGIACGVLLIVAELRNIPATTAAAHEGLHQGWPCAERLFLFGFGAVHVAVAAIITVFRRTAV